MTTSNKPNYYKARETADLIFKKITDHKYPVNTLKIILKLKNIKISTYENFSRKINCNINCLKECSSDAFTICKVSTQEIRYVILYNSEVNTIGRIRFSIAHELGHIFLNHFNGKYPLLEKGGLTEEIYQKYETEANTFANELLIPPCLLKGDYEIEDIRKKFDVSKQAAKISIEIKENHPFLNISYILRSALKNNDSIFRHSSLFEKIIPRESHTLKSFNSLIISYKKPSIYFCKSCLNAEKCYLQNLEYCPVCGKENLVNINSNQYYLFHELMEGTVMKYPGLKVNTSGKLEENCPICGNEEIKGNYCTICGIYVVNECSGWHKKSENFSQFEDPCYKSLDGSDRYCPYCGAMSTFLTNGLLQEWDSINPFAKSNIK